MDHFDPYSVATNISVLLMTGFVVQGYILHSHGQPEQWLGVKERVVGVLVCGGQGCVGPERRGAGLIKMVCNYTLLCLEILWQELIFLL